MNPKYAPIKKEINAAQSGPVDIFDSIPLMATWLVSAEPAINVSANATITA
jgi:hypothetical protein